MRALAPLLVSAIFAARAIAAPGSGTVEPAKELPLEDREAFAFDILPDAEQIYHPLSGLVCPFGIEGHQLIRIVQYSMSGHDVSCGYNSPDGGSTLTFYFSHYGTNETPARTVESGLAAIRQRGHFGNERENGPATLVFGGTEYSDCRVILLDSDTSGGGKKTGVWGCNFNGWVYKIRATWSGADADTMAGVKAFSAAQHTARERADMCATWQSNTGPAAQTIEDSTISMAVMVQITSDRIQDRPESDGPDDVSQCYVGEWKGEVSTTLLVAHPQSDSIAAQVHGADVNGFTGLGIVRIVRADPGLEDLLASLGHTVSESGAWLLLADMSAAETGIFRVYSGRPNARQSIDDVVEVVDGKRRALASISFDEEGNSTINIEVDD